MGKDKGERKQQSEITSQLIYSFINNDSSKVN